VVGSKKLPGMLNSLAGMLAVNDALDPNVVVMAVPFHMIVLPLTNPVPVAVSVRGAVSPLVEVFGLIEVRVGGVPEPAPVTVSTKVLVVELSGLVTPTVIVPAFAIAVAATVACSCVAESNVVVMAVPFRVMAAPETKPTPVAVNVKDALPAATAEGDMLVSSKEPFPEPPVTVSMIVPDVVLSGFSTRMLTVPPDAICAAVTFAVSFVDEVTVVGSEVPSHNIVVPLTKFDPVAVRVNAAPPAATVVGVMDVNVGAKIPLKPPHPLRNAERTESNRKN